MHYIIDGSNLLYYSRYVEECGGDVIMARHELNQTLANAAANRGNTKITIVYDVRSWVGSNKEKTGLVNIIYAVGPRDTQPADKEILKLLERTKQHDGDTTVVTNDSTIRQNAVFSGCSSMDCQKFWQKFRLDNY